MAARSSRTSARRTPRWSSSVSNAPPGIEAARILRAFGDAGVAPPGFPTADEDTNAESFQSGSAAFMVNYPFIWGKATSAVEEGTLPQSVPDDYGWTVYPQTTPDRPSAPPLGGINLGVGAFSEHPDLAYEATTCISSPANSPTTSSRTATRPRGPRSSTTRRSWPSSRWPRSSATPSTLAKPRPQTPYYAEVSGGIQRTFHPPGSVTPGATNEAATALITAVLRKEALL